MIQLTDFDKDAIYRVGQLGGSFMDFFGALLLINDRFSSEGGLLTTLDQETVDALLGPGVVDVVKLKDVAYWASATLMTGLSASNNDLLSKMNHVRRAAR